MANEIEKQDAAAAAHTAAAQAHTEGRADAMAMTKAAWEATLACTGLVGFDEATAAIRTAHEGGDATPEHEDAAAQHETEASRVAWAVLMDIG